jgi:hypothetical protein
MRTNVVIKENWQLNGHDVWLLEAEPGENGKAYVLYSESYGDGKYTGTRRAEWHHDSPPSFQLPEGFLNLLVTQGTQLEPPSTAQAAHLTDAMQVRDRLLRFVERTQGEPDSPPTRPAVRGAFPR